MSWEQLIRLGILGTDKGKLSPELKEWMEGLEIDTNQNSAAQLLDAIAIKAAEKKAARLPSTYQGAIPSQAPIEEANLCSAKSVTDLNLIMEGTYEAALPEFLYLLSKNNKILPPESLPELLNRCLKQAHLWESIQKSIGKRGAWLTGQHPEWSQLNKIPLISEWEWASKNDRLIILKYFCKNEVNKVLPLLQSTWEKDTIHHKKAFLKILGANPDASFEPFLENLLDDNRKEIRKLASDILGNMPNSRLVARMFDRLKDLIELKSRTLGKSKFNISLPEAIDESLLRDGMHIKSQGLKAGLLSARLQYMLSLVPPLHWETHFKLKREKLLEVAVRSDWSEIVVQGWINASARFKNEVWMGLLLEFWLVNCEKPRWSKLEVKPILDVLSDGVFNKIMIKHLQYKKGFIEESDPIMVVLKSGNHIWQDKLMLLFFNNIKSWLSAQGSRYWSGWHYKGIVNKVAYTCNPNLYDILWKDWNSSESLWQGWEKQMVEFLDVLKFRKAMTQSLENN